MTLKRQEPSELKLRVYAIIENKGKYLLSKEKYGDFEFTKFPGGGLELGETPIECLKRELHEELAISTNNFELFHVAEVFVQNRFDPKQQVIGIYYKAKPQSDDIKHINSELEVEKKQGKLVLTERLWLDKNELKSQLTFEMDQDAANQLK